ncbi:MULTISPECIES: serine hydrolase domain-containing protein [unclassified Brevibacterium]|uniref:serine hydrolase domain-containing protein n=1 Tax=unclassified Brevibacterium TaxID=2614124 RepID=UPI001091CC5E|nr:serine hydrolase domain-containing protein [Brevibacterium sp. S22]TGD29800.1 class A beta-lactamase-related serine hydrolase [Brevibacterium sp. S22]
MHIIGTHRTSQQAAKPPRRRMAGFVAAAITAALLAALTPWPRGFQGAPTGDAAFMSELEETLGSKHWQHVAAARIDGDDTTFAGTGADEHTEFESGSITKTFTAALFADAIDRGEVEADTRLGEVWPQLDGKVAEVTLESIAMQRSGLPSQEPAPSFSDGVMSVLSNYLHTDPYRGDVADIVASLNDVEVGEPEPEYSNFGFAVLGQALAEAAGQDYSELVRDRLTEPLGMKETFVPDSADGLSHGYTASGLPAAPWTLGGAAPAGAIRSTTHDLAIWLRAVRDGNAPGAEAAEPRTDFEADRIGWAWFTTKTQNATLTWHNGGTGGYRSFLGFDPESGAGIIVLNDSANDVDAAATLVGADAGTDSGTTTVTEAGSASTTDAVSAGEASAKGERS